MQSKQLLSFIALSALKILSVIGIIISTIWFLSYLIVIINYAIHGNIGFFISDFSKEGVDINSIVFLIILILSLIFMRLSKKR